MICEEVKDLITALVDNELSRAERESLEGHLRDCHRCQLSYKQEQVLKEAVRTAGIRLKAPAHLGDRILSDPRIFSETAQLREQSGRFRPWAVTLQPAFVLALLVLLVLPTLYLMRPGKPSVSLSALLVHERILAGAVSFTRAASQDGVKERLLRSVGGEFAPMGYDLSMMSLQAVGGVVQEIQGRKILVTVYEGKGPSLTCHTFLGTEAEAPVGASLFFDQEKKINFYTFSRNGVNAVFHREGRVICILVSKMPLGDLLALARAKAQPKTL